MIDPKKIIMIEKVDKDKLARQLTVKKEINKLLENFSYTPKKSITKKI